MRALFVAHLKVIITLTETESNPNTGQSIMTRFKTVLEIQKIQEDFEKLHKIIDHKEINEKCYSFLKDLGHIKHEHPRIKMALNEMKFAVIRLLQLLPVEEHNEVTLCHSTGDSVNDGLIIDR